MSTLTARIRMRRGTLATWNGVDPDLKSGEIGIVTDTTETGIDGTVYFLAKFCTVDDTAWSDLDYMAFGVKPIASNTENDSGVSGSTVKDALDTLLTTKFNTSEIITSTSLAGYSNTNVPATQAIKQYVDNIVEGFDPKEHVRAATTVNITLSGAQTIDGVSVIAGDRVLVKNQSAPAQNGIYVCASGAWTRASDCDTGLEMELAYVQIREGSTLALTEWRCTTHTITLNTTAVTWQRWYGANYTADETTITQSGFQFAVKDDGISAAKIAAASLKAIAALTPAADKGMYFTSGSVAALFDLSSLSRTLLACTTAATMRSTIGAEASDNYEKCVLSGNFTTNSATYVDVTGLLVTLDASSTYQVTIHLPYQSPATNTGAGLSLTATGSPTTRNASRIMWTGGAAITNVSSNSDDGHAIGVAVTAAAATLGCTITATVKTSGSTSVLQVRAARGGTSGAITVIDGASILAVKIG